MEREASAQSKGVWLAIGCGLLALVALCGLFAVGYYFYAQTQTWPPAPSTPPTPPATAS